MTDNGPGIASETIIDILDYNSRVSSREAYVSPTRGAQGNALKTILAMPFALDGESGETIIESRGVAHRIEFSIDPVRLTPQIRHTPSASLVKNGTKVTVRWPNSTSSILDDAKERFLQVAEDYTWVNPHLGLTIEWCRSGEKIRWPIAATTQTWAKWRPSDPTSPHWYDESRLSRLMAAQIAHAEDHDRPCPTVREFVSEFRGLSGTTKAKVICEAADASRLSLADFYGDGASARMGALLASMRGQSRPIKPRDLGPIGKDHLAAKFESLGVAPETFNYRRAEFEHEAFPISPKPPSAIARAAATKGASSRASIGRSRSAPTPSANLARTTKVLTPSSPISGPGRASRL